MSTPTPAVLAARPAPAPAMPTVREHAQSILKHMDWEDCTCGKRRTSSRVDAETRVLLLRIANGDEHTNPTRYYPCEKEPGVVHWTTAPPRPKTSHDCPCGRRSYLDQATSNKVADHRNRRAKNPAITTIAYGCSEGGWHTAVYPVGEKLRQCPCGFIGYRSREAAQVMLEHYQEHSPFCGEDGIVTYECERGVLHVGPAARVKVTRLHLLGTDAPPICLPDSLAPLRAAVGLDLSGAAGARAEALAPAFRAAARAAYADSERLGRLAREHTTLPNSKSFHMDLIRAADALEAHPDAVVEVRR